MKTQQFFPRWLLLSVVVAMLVLLAMTSWLAPIAVGGADGNSVSVGAPVRLAQGDSVNLLQENLTNEPEPTPTPVPAATRAPATIPPNLPPLVAALNRTTAAKTWRYSIQTILIEPSDKHRTN